MSASHKIIGGVVDTVESVVLGKRPQIRLALACLLARGHLLIEDVPGMGKTTLAQALARVLGLSYSRVQFTSDLLPADIIGVSVFDRERSAFEFHPGPIFSQLVLADEINRTTPKTQSALLEAMSEGQVSVDGETRLLPQPFFVIATQNPSTQYGTFPLPESQLDRFLMRIDLGYPDPESERRLLSGANPRTQLPKLTAGVSAAQLSAIQTEVEDVQVSDALVGYVQRLVQHTRELPDLEYGVSPRGALALLQGARAWALMDGRQYVIPEDVQAVFAPIIGHRLHSYASGEPVGAVVQQVLNSVDIL
ncbi:MAG: MoxR family ATPase [Porticoccaceae bacterium]|nr:MoxR family ATPase [Porticoccaceae bacterium]